MKTLILFLLIGVLSGCASKDLTEHKVRHPEYWKKHNIGKSLADKLIEVDDDLLNYYHLGNEKEGYSSRPKKVVLSSEQIQIVHEALAELPSSVQKLINNNLLGFFFVEDLGSSAGTDSVFFNKGKADKGFMVFDIKVLTKTANDWCSFKERTPFKEDPDWKLDCKIAGTKDNDFKHAFQYIFLHESGHIVNLTTPFLEFWDDWITTPEAWARQSFPQISWEFQKSELVSKYDVPFSIRPQIKYYSDNEQLPAENVKQAYEQLSKTSFPTLYASINYADDWAEVFANYIHVMVLKRPFEIAISHKGKKVFRLNHCWESRRCAEKRALMESYLSVQ